MKKTYLAIILLAGIAVLGCTKDNGGNQEGNDKPKNNYTITVSDSVIGEEQDIALSTNYTSDNPNILVTWFDNGERQNKLARTHTNFIWTAGKAGDHTIKCSITDRNDVIEFETKVKVIPCDFDKALIGDAKDKILRTYGDPKYTSGNTLGFGYYNDDVREISFSSNKVSRIHFEKHYQWPSVNQYPHLGMLSMYEEQVTNLSKKYGKTTDATNLGSTQAEKEEKALSIYNSGAMYATWKYNGHTVTLMAMRSSVYKPGYYWQVEVE